MRPIASFTDLPSLEAAFTEWWEVEAAPKFAVHSTKIAAAVPREAILWKPEMINCADAFTFAEGLRPDAEDFETQALGLLAATFTVAEAKKEAHRIVKATNALKRLSKSADRKLSTLQSLNKQ